MSLREDRVNLIVTMNGDPARKELAGLEKKAFDVRDAMKGMKKGTEEYANAQKDLKAMNDRMDDIRRTMNLSQLTTRELNAELKKLMAARSYLVPNTEAFAANAEQIKAVKQRMFDLNQEIKVGEGFWSKLKTQAAQFGVMAAGFLGIQALWGKVQSLTQSNYKLSDSLSDVMKTTGLTQKEVEELNKSISKIDTRTSREDLLKLAMEAGKLGKDSAADVLKFVEEADKIKVALGADLGDDAIISIGKLSKIFGTEMLNIASAINSVGQASEASEQYQVDFLNRLAGVSQTAKISAPDLLGYSAALEINGQTAEKSGTALTNFFIDFVKDTEKYGKAAGFMKGELTKLVGDQGTNVAFKEFLTRLKEGSSSSQDLLAKMEQLGIDGAKGAGIFLTLSNNIGLVNTQQKLANESFTAGTSVIDEFNVRNENFAATVDKLQKRFASWFSGGAIMNGLKSFVGILSQITDSRTDLDQSTEAWQRSVDAVKRYEATMPALITRYEELKKLTTPTKEEQEELRKVIVQIAEYIPTAITQFDEYGNAMEINVDKAKKFGDELRAMMEIKNRQALVDARAAIFDVRTEIENLQFKLNQRDAQGDLFKVVAQNFRTANGEIRTVFENVKLTDEEITTLKNNLQSKQLELKGHEQIVNELAGVALYADKAGQAIKTMNSPTPGDPLVGDGVIKATGDDLKKLQKELDDYIAKIKELDKQFKNSKLDKDEQALQGIRDRYNPLIDQAKGHEALNDKDAAIYREERIKLEEQLAEALALKKEEFRQRDLLEKQKAEDELFTATLDSADRQVMAEADKWDRLITLARKYGLDETALITTKGIAIQNIRKKQQADEQKDAEAQRKKISDIEKKRIDDTRVVTESVGKIFTSMFDLLAEEEGQYTEYQKSLALVQLGIDTATSISGALAGASDLPWPGNLAAYSSSVAQILSFMVTARKYFSDTSMPKKMEDGGAVVPDGPSHAQGGLKIVDSKSNKVVAEGEGRELYVFSKKFVQNNPDLVNAIMDASNNNNGIMRRPGWMDEQPRVINMPLVSRANRFQQFENGGQILEFMQQEEAKSTNPHVRTGRVVVNGRLEELIEENISLMRQMKKQFDDGLNTYMVQDEFDKSRKDWELKKKNSLLAS